LFLLGFAQIDKEGGRGERRRCRFLPSGREIKKDPEMQEEGENNKERKMAEYA
jgi:hypothetical protein